MWSNLTSNIKTLSGHTADIRSLKILPSDGRLASASFDMTVRIWNLTNGTLDMTLYGHKSSIYSMDLLANGYLVSGGSDLILLVWNTTSGSLVKNITNAHSGTILVVKTINQYYFATGSVDKLVKVL
jgi:WD40 repeat protein